MRARPDGRALSLFEAARTGLRDGDSATAIDVLDSVQKLDALGHRPLESLPSADQSHAACALIDDRRLHRLGQVALSTARPTRVDEPDPAHVAVRDLVQIGRAS